MQSRQPRTLDEFGSHFFGPDAAPIAKRLREILARQVSVDLSRLSPDDRFIEDLQMVELDSLSTVNLVVDIEREFGIKIPDADAGKIRTLRDLVEYVSRTAKHTAA